MDITAVHVLRSNNFIVKKENALRAQAFASSMEGCPPLTPFQRIQFEGGPVEVLTHFNFCGTGSGYGFDTGVFDLYACATEGEADLLIVWHNGLLLTGVKIRSGAVTKHRVNIVLEDSEIG